MKHFATLFVIGTAALLNAQTPDPTFGSAGVVLTDFAANEDDAQDVAIQTDGRIVVAGYTFIGGVYQGAVARYMPDGSLDATFGTGGKVTLLAQPAGTICNAVVLQPDGRILLGGHVFIGSTADLMVARLHPDGTMDASFGTAGIAMHVTFPTGALYVDMALRSDGVIAIAGRTISTGPTSCLVVQLLTDGNLDNSFSGDGVQPLGLSSFDSEATAVAVQPDGMIVLACNFVAGVSDEQLAVLRLLPTGSVDIDFGGFGSFTHDLPGVDDISADVALQADGKILVAGRLRPTADKDIMALRLEEIGVLDTTFGDSGVVQLNVPGDQEVDALAIDADGGLILSCTVINADEDIRVMRLLPDGTADATYDATFNIAGDDNTSAIVIQTDGKVIVAGENNDSDPTADMLVMRFGAPGSTSIHDAARPDDHFRIAPNPVDHLFTLECDVPLTNGSAITVRDMTGRILPLTSTIHPGGATIDASSLSSGIYTLSVRDGKGDRTTRFIKE